MASSMTNSVKEFLATRTALEDIPSIAERDYILCYPPSRAAIAEQMHKCVGAIRTRFIEFAQPTACQACA